MKRLLHVKVVHDSVFRDLKSGAEQTERYHRELEKYYDDIVIEGVLRFNDSYNFNRVYAEGYTGDFLEEEKIKNGLGIIYKPVRVLVQMGVELTKTEHYLSRLIGSILKEEFQYDFFKVIKKLSNIPLEKIIEIFSQFTTKEYLSEFFHGLSTFDFNAARENWMGRNIESTLRDGEAGIIFIGKGHSEERIRAVLTNTDYKVIDLFDKIL